jgi:hypothetical protein
MSLLISRSHGGGGTACGTAAFYLFIRLLPKMEGLDGFFGYFVLQIVVE